MDGIFLVHREHYRPRILTLLTFISRAKNVLPHLPMAGDLRIFFNRQWNCFCKKKKAL